MLIPLLLVRDLSEAIAFYTRVLDFGLEFISPQDHPFYAGLKRNGEELHLNLVHGGTRVGTSSVIILCDDVDGLFNSFLARGLTIPARPDSPVHAGPIDQTWGSREIYIDDPSGNTMIFQQRQA